MTETITQQPPTMPQGDLPLLLPTHVCDLLGVGRDWLLRPGGER